MAEHDGHGATDNNLYPVNIRQMRLVYRDLIASSAAGDNIFRALSGMAPVCRIMQYTVVWTGDAEVPVVVRRDVAFHSGEREDRSVGVWYKLHSRSRLYRIIQNEAAAYYPDATRPYHSLNEFGLRSYKLVIGNKLVSVSFDESSPLARLEQQRHSLLDMISQALLDFSRRQLRHLQEQNVSNPDQDNDLSDMQAVDRQVAAFMSDETSEEMAMMILHKHASVLEYFFGFTHVEYVLSPDISSVLFRQQDLDSTEVEGRSYKYVRLTMSDYPGTRDFRPGMQKLEIPLIWGAENATDSFIIRLYCHNHVNPHVRRELLLNQALLLGKSELEALFDKRYRELRIAQDTSHFRRCKQVRTSIKGFHELRDHLVNSLPEYASFERVVDSTLVFPRFAEWRDALQPLFVDVDEDWLVFQNHIRLSDLLEYKYLDIRAPAELMDILTGALRVDVKLKVDSPYPVLARLSDPPPSEELADQFAERVIHFNDAATVSVLIPREVDFPFQRVAEMFDEYLDSIGEGMGRLFHSISMMTGIQNRSSLMKKLEHLIQQVHYSHHVQLDVSSLDIVSFKIFNELLGHPFGDRVIRLVAQLLDTVAPDMAFHVSGDEYYLIHCWYSSATEPWVRDFFKSYNIIGEDDYLAYRKRLDAIARGQPVAVPLTDVATEIPEELSLLGTFRLVDLIRNFFTRDPNGNYQLKKYSRTGNDYHTVIWDPQKRIQALVDKAWEAVQAGTIVPGEENFASFVLAASTVGERIFILPKLTIGTMHYDNSQKPPYASDIIEAADAEAGKNKK